MATSTSSLPLKKKSLPPGPFLRAKTIQSILNSEATHGSDQSQISTLSFKKLLNPMTPEHIAKLQAGRKASKQIKPVADPDESFHPRVQQRLNKIQANTPQYLNVTRKAYLGTSKTACIKAKCLDCSCWQRIEITNCTVLTCPLWLVRPYQSNEPDDAQE